MTLQDFKDQVSKESAEKLKTDWKNWNDLSHAMWSVPAHLLALSDRAATLFADHERKEAADAGYKEGYTDAYEGRPHKFSVQKDWGDELPY